MRNHAVTFKYQLQDQVITDTLCLSVLLPIVLLQSPDLLESLFVYKNVDRIMMSHCLYNCIYITNITFTVNFIVTL